MRNDGGGSGGRRADGARCIALVGPFLAGKTALLEAILTRTGAIQRPGRAADHNTVGDASEEARSHGMSTELTVAETEFLGDRFIFVDCPGSIEFKHSACAALDVADMAIVVSEPDPKRVPALQLILRDLEDRGIPHVLFLNKIDQFDKRVRDILPILQPASRRPLVLRQVPIWENDIVTGFVDLALERAFIYREHKPSEVVDIPADMRDREKDARFHMLEQLADYDDELMEALLSDLEPPRDRVFDDLARELREGLICPVVLGSAEHGNGILRLLKMIRHEAPGVADTRRRLGLEGRGSAVAVMETRHTAHGGKLSVARILAGEVGDGTVLSSPRGEDRVAGVFSLLGASQSKRPQAKAGDVVALGRLDHAATGDVLAADRGEPGRLPGAGAPLPVFSVAIALEDRKDEVKLSAAMHKLAEEDPALVFSNDPDTHQMLLNGQGEMHLRGETIRAKTEQRGRHRKQSGGHGQFGDVVLVIEPLPRGGGLVFNDRISGGVVPRQFIPSVEKGVREYMNKGPLGFPVVDIAVSLTDGSYHAVDSSDAAFQMAARLAMAEGMEKCAPVLLEPIMAVEVHTPCDHTSRINQIITGHRGHLLGFDGRRDWPGWDTVQAHIPEAELQNFIIELRSATQGAATFVCRFDHLSELTGKLAEQAVARRAEAHAA